jgi:hypothetical protein
MCKSRFLGMLQIHWNVLVRANTIYLDLLVYVVVFSMGYLLMTTGSSFFQLSTTLTPASFDSVQYDLTFHLRPTPYSNYDILVFMAAIICMSCSLAGVVCTLFYQHCTLCLFLVKTVVGVCLLSLITMKMAFFSDIVTPIVLFWVWFFSFVSLLKT